MKVEALRAKPVSNLASPRANTPSHSVYHFNADLEPLQRTGLQCGGFLRSLAVRVQCRENNKKMHFSL